MDIVNFTSHIEEKHANDDLENALAQAFSKVFNDHLNDKLNDLVNYGTPHFGSNTVVERFSKQEGLAILRRDDVGGTANDRIMRVILATWLSLPSPRGLNLLQFVLTMLWTDKWLLKPLFHSWQHRDQYPRHLIEPDADNKELRGFWQGQAPSDAFLTSRYNLVLDDSISLYEVRDLVPVVRKLVPANVVLKVIASSENKDLTVEPIRVAMAAKLYQFVNLT